ncbi:MAG TPA: serine hydrolase [Candidatus Eremiobacteraceae bacterium]|nr:serine hydrolase [Candidatus Eremiobacteraceae bacterium]
MSRGVALVVFFIAMVFGAGFWAQEHYLKTAVSTPPAVRAEAAPTSIDPKVVAAIQARVAKSGADVGIAFETLDVRLTWSSRGDDVFHAASTMKIPVMIELFHQVREGKVKLSDPLPIKNEFHSLVNGSVFTLKPADDSETDLYKAVGQTRTLDQLCDLMVTVSSNFATNLLIQKFGIDNVRATVTSLHADGMDIKRGVEDQKAFDKGLNNTTTAHGLATLLVAIANGKAVDADSSAKMVEILERQKFNEGIPAGVPANIRVAHKTGEITKIHHDAGIVYAERPFVIVVLVRGIEDFKQSSALIAGITRDLYQASQVSATSH